jgi:indole-3-glycerol phosphate synthase
LIDTVPDILARIVHRKREELARPRPALAHLESAAAQSLAERRDFRAAIKLPTPAVIAEIKQASPSRGLLAADFNPVRTAAAYQQGGASAISVLTDESFFQGSLHHLQQARAAITLPVLRKDFTLDPYHVLEAAAHGADAILLIVAILDDRELRDLREAAERWNMAVLVEVHDASELDRAIASGARIIGVNNRNLTNFHVTLSTSLRLAERMPAHVVRVSESGIHSAADIQQLHRAGYHAFLVGEHLMQSPRPDLTLRELVTPA